MKTFITTVLCLFVLQLSAQTVTVTGTVSAEQDVPLNGANIVVRGTKLGVQSDFDGNYSIEAEIDQQLVFTYVGMRKVTIRVTEAGPLNIKMELKPEEMGVVYIISRGVKKPAKSAPIAITTLTAEDIENRAQPDILRNIVGKVPGAQIIPISGALGGGTKFTIRSSSSITGDNDPLFIVDGVPFNTSTNYVTEFGGGVVTSSRSLDLDPNNIEKLQVLRGLSATVLYGQDGRNGVVLITTKTGSFNPNSLAPDLPYSERYLEEQEVARTRLANERTAVELGYYSPYQSVVKSINSSNSKFKTYLDAQSANKTDAVFYIDVYDRFKKIEPEFAARVLANYAEVNSNDASLLKVLAYKLEEENRFDLAVKVYRKILKLLPKEPQSYRDLGLALQEVGKPEEAYKLLLPLSGNKNSKALRGIVTSEVNNLVITSKAFNTSEKVKKDELFSYQMDMRIVVDWNRNDANLDLQIIDPNLEVCSVDNTKTKTGGILFGNNMAGFGPEAYELKDIQTGSYYLKIGYSTGEETLIKPSGTTYVKLTVFRNYGKPNQTKEIKLIRISEEEDLQLLDRIAVL